MNTETASAGSDASAAASVRIARVALEEWTAQVLVKVGLDPEDTALASRILVRTDARGFKTHGVARIRSYLDKIRSGEMAAKFSPRRSSDGCLYRINAGGALGQVAGPKAVEEAVAVARSAPLVACQLQDAGHLGALGINILPAAEAGMVALMFQATPPVIGLPGGSMPIIGNNPLAMAAPRPNGPPIVIDMACCVAARGNILLAARNGEPIPEGWALDQEGQPTNDPDAALLGALLPFGGHKGMALAMMVEILAGSLAGVPFRASLNEGDAVKSGTGHVNALILVINPDLVYGRPSYDEHVAAWTTHYKGKGSPDARIPGERAHQSEDEADRLGVPIPKVVLPELQKAGEEAGLPFPTGAEPA